MSLFAYDRWTVEVLRLSGTKSYAIWLLLQQHPSLFNDDVQNDPQTWYSLMNQPGLVWLGIYEREALVGLVYLDFGSGDGNVEVHLVFFDRKPAEKTELLKQLLPVVLQTFPKIKRLTTTVPDIYRHTWKLAKRLGMHWSGTLRGAQSIRGQRRDVYVFDLLREEVR